MSRVSSRYFAEDVLTSADICTDSMKSGQRHVSVFQVVVSVAMKYDTVNYTKLYIINHNIVLL